MASLIMFYQRKRRRKPLLALITSFLLLLIVPSCSGTPPKFLLDQATIGGGAIVVRLKEGTPIGTKIFHLRGIDADNDQLRFGVSTNPDNVVKVVNDANNEASVLLAKELDAEERLEYQVVLTLTDNKLGGNFIARSMLILVEDTNDNRPEFKPHPSTVIVDEDVNVGTVVATLEARDRDSGIFGQVVYALDPTEKDNDMFEVRMTQKKGIVTVKNPLDYERQSVHQLKVLASDRGGFGNGNTATAAILVKVGDVPDQPPEFVDVPSITRIPEDLPVFSEVSDISRRVFELCKK